MVDRSGIESIPFNEVTDEQIYQAYLNCHAVSNHHTWEAAKSNPALYLALKHQAAFAPVVAHKQQRQAELEAAEKPSNSDTVFRKSTYVLSRAQAVQIMAAAYLAQNCLQSSFLSASAREEAIAQLRHVRSIFSNKKSGLNLSSKG